MENPNAAPSAGGSREIGAGLRSTFGTGYSSLGHLQRYISTR